ncbi:MAG: phenylacetate--CoA ligase [Caldimicrobium sp.]|nr:phenylacetate--CoA ligase [Caldimicrobium sp.]MCX7612714.1 phenylacetate--CoA ligase [Caldimicrobium sp.]MDW8183347.1 phenylacetate--CoA ligase [Caldimicrobium sp.]
MSKDLKFLQLERLQAVLNRVYKEVPFYRALFDREKLDPEEFGDLSDLNKYPFTTREDLQKNYPYNMFAVPLREVVRIQASTGTTGEPIVAGYTRNDLAILADLNAKALKSMGLTKEDVVQISFHAGLFSSAFGIQSGAEKIGASVIPINFEDPKKQLKILQDYRTTTLVCTPSYALWLAEVLPQTNINPNSLMVKRIILCGEAFTEKQRSLIEEKFKARVYNLYAVMEIFGAAVAYECHERKGLHFQEEHFLVEVLNPETLLPVKAEEVGEIVITTLTKEALPLVRYRTGDLVIIKEGLCPCGNVTLLTSGILGRKDEILSVRGIKFHPSQVEKIIEETTGERLEMQIHLYRSEGVERITLLVALGESLFSDSFAEQEKVRERLEEHLYLELNLPIVVKFIERSSFERKDGKILKVVDKR